MATCATSSSPARVTLESPNVCDLDATHLPKLNEVLPLFSMAVQRSMDELNARIQTEIKERFTAIHPVVEWRFRKAVLDELEHRGHPGPAELQPIVFENVPVTDLTQDNIVQTQSPDGGSQAKRGSTVTIFVGKF